MLPSREIFIGVIRQERANKATWGGGGSWGEGNF